MVAWGIRITTFVTNSLVLVGYALVFEWLKNAKLSPKAQRLRTTYLVLMTVAFLALFHFASVFSIIEAHNSHGFGWSYINFQVATVMYAVMSCHKRPLLFSLAFVLLVWYWWLPHVPDWLPYYLAAVALMLSAQYFKDVIWAHWWVYYPFSYLFILPFWVVNLYSLRGIDSGWLWNMVNSCLIFAMLWYTHLRLKRQRRQQALLREEARIDELTDLYNFRVFNEDLLLTYQASQQAHTSYALYTMDIDHFKQINDQYGHLIGNRVLEQVASRLKALTHELPGTKVRCYRTGGEEFSLLVPQIEASCTLGATIAWRLHDELSALHFTAEDGTPFGITVSLGEEVADPEDRNYLDIYRRADEYLYNSKRSGRNTVTVRGQTAPPRDEA